MCRHKQFGANKINKNITGCDKINKNIYKGGTVWYKLIIFP